MRKVERVCLIGPDAWAAGAASRIERQDAACQRAGFQPVRVDLGAGRKDAERSDTVSPMVVGRPMGTSPPPSRRGGR